MLTIERKVVEPVLNRFNLQQKACLPFKSTTIAITLLKCNWCLVSLVRSVVEVVVELLHVLFSEVDESVSLLGRVRDTPVGVNLVLGSIGRVISVGEANVHGKGRVSHKLGTTRHDRISVWVGVCVGPEFFFSLAEQSDGLFGLAAALLVKEASYLGRLLVENIPIDAPAAQEPEGLSIQAGGLQ